MRPTVEPTEVAGLSFDDGAKSYTHPAFGQIIVNRVTGHSILYGSDFVHDHYVNISIHASKLSRHLSRDWRFAEREYIEIALSEAQWATFVSSFGVGSGVPCTVSHLNGAAVPGIPQRAQTSEFKNEFSARTQNAEAELRETIKALAANDKIPAGQRKAILGQLESVLREMTGNLSLVADQFNEYIEETVEKAKVEAHAYLSHVVTDAGLTALGADRPKQIERAYK